MPDPNPPPPGEAANVDEELAQAQAYVRKLHAYLEPRMLRRMKAVCLAGQMPPKVGGEGSLRGWYLMGRVAYGLQLAALGSTCAQRARRRPRRSEQQLLVLRLPANVVWLRR